MKVINVINLGISLPFPLRRIPNEIVVSNKPRGNVYRCTPGGFYDANLAEKLVKYLFAPRNAMDPAEAYRKFRGRDAKIDALMRDRGFPVPEDAEE